MGAGALTICRNRAAVHIKEDMKRMAQLPLIRARPADGRKVFGVSLSELGEAGLLRDGIPLPVRSMVEFLREHALQQEGLFRVNGNVRAVEGLRLRFESGGEVDLRQEEDACTVASLLKQFLRDLPGGLITASVQPGLLQLYQECGGDQSRAIKEILRQLPDLHYNLLKYLCLFLTQVESRHLDNRMTALNLATVFGPNVFHVSPGFDGIKEQNLCNKIMVKLIQNYSAIFESDVNVEDPKENCSDVITVKEAQENRAELKSPADKVPTPRKKKAALSTQTENVDLLGESATEPPTPTPRKKKTAQIAKPENVEESATEILTSTPRKKKTTRSTQAENLDPVEESGEEILTSTPRKKKVRKVRCEEASRDVPQPVRSEGLPQLRVPVPRARNREEMETSSDDVTAVRVKESLSSLPESERPISPFYMSSPCSATHRKADSAHFLERTIRLAVEQHLFDTQAGSGLAPSSGLAEVSPAVAVTTKQMHPRQKDLDESQKCDDMSSIDKENIPSSTGNGLSPDGERRHGGSNHSHDPRTPRAHRHGNPSTVRSHRHDSQEPFTVRSHCRDNQDPLTVRSHRCDNQDFLTERFCESSSQKTRDGDSMESSFERSDRPERDSGLFPQSLPMKIQEISGNREPGRGSRMGDLEGCEGLPALTQHSGWGDDPPVFTVPVLDFKTICQQSYYAEPVTADCSWQRENMDREEAHLSPHVGGRLIQQLLEEDSDPMLSPRSYGYGHCQQYLDDTEVPPSPPNAHSFMRRRRSSSLGSCEEERVVLSAAQLSKKLHSLKKKISRFEEKFEEDRKYRPSHSDKAANPEVLRWMNELSKLRKELKEHKIHKSEEDLPPLSRPRSNTLPKSFGSQLDKETKEKVEPEKEPVPAVESTLESVQKTLQEKREEEGRPEDIKDMTREQIGAEKVALQKALLHYENIHGRPVTKTERDIMKPLYDRYRLVKQILCRASTIPIIGSPSSKRRGLPLPPILEGEPAQFFDEIKEEEEGSEDDGDSQTHISGTFRPELSVVGFSLAIDELAPPKNSADTRLSNLHSATMQELVEQLQEAREEKKSIRKNLREFEDQFFRENGRNVQKEDRSPLAQEYNEYKHIKAKLRLLEVLISKRNSSKFI
ncbi:protein FAM13A isoform X3 [Anguilla anguilla]|uniref:protein FAM13A isoform X3 n=1 Tax=Anguilla anguilla TaxID=7936 RepID=UPI0015AAC904|nr:protein FAM13A isoform X3 [Anguilla anguilla]